MNELYAEEKLCVVVFHLLLNTNIWWVFLFGTIGSKNKNHENMRLQI